MSRTLTVSESNVPAMFRLARLASGTERTAGFLADVIGEHVTPMAHQRQTRGDDHVTQTLACCSCGRVAGRCSFGADFRLCVGWLARQASRFWLGCSKLPCWRPRLLWLRRLLCAATGPDTVGPPLAP